MDPALQRALLQSLIDHAALFPPASLTMSRALDEDGLARESEHAWMFDRFVCPASRLGELEGLSAPLSVVLDGVLPAPGQAAALETRLDAPRPDSRELLRAAQSLRELSHEVYFELVMEERWRDSVPATIGAIAAVGGRVKLRCGGLTVPSCEQVALVLVACRRAGVVMKATAGLHHALRGQGRHGFLNLLCAATHALCRDAGERAIIGMLEAEVLAELPFEELEAGDAIEARRRLFKGFGCCSWREPLEDLRALGWLE